MRRQKFRNYRNIIDDTYKGKFVMVSDGTSHLEDSALDGESNFGKYEAFDKLKRVLIYHADHPEDGLISKEYLSNGLGKMFSEAVLALDPQDKKRIKEAIEIRDFLDVVLSS